MPLYGLNAARKFGDIWVDNLFFFSFFFLYIIIIIIIIIIYVISYMKKENMVPLGS